MPNTPHKPHLRGVLHQYAAFGALGAGAVLVAMAATSRGAIAAAVFALSLVALFTVSATYHRVQWSTVARARMRRLDHASIFLLIAGSYTPLAMLGLPASEGSSLLLAVWGGAAVGVVKSLFWAHAPKLVTALVAVAVGWTIVPYLGDAWQALPSAVFVLIGVGGVAYTGGAVVYALRRPNPRPGVFGYHEVFHALTIVGAGTHFAAMVILVGPR